MPSWTSPHDPRELAAIAQVFADLCGADADVWILGERKRVLILVPEREDFDDDVKRQLEDLGLVYSSDRGGFLLLTD